MTTDLFAAAKKVPSKTATKKADVKDEIQMGNDLSTYIAVDYLLQSLTGLKETIGAEVKDNQANIFAELGIQSGLQPESFIGTADEGNATMVFGKRSTRSPLNDEQIAMLEDSDLTACYTRNVTKADAFFINPALFADPVKMKKFSDALNKAGLTQIDGESILLHQEEESTIVASDDAIKLIFQKAKGKNWKAGRVRELLDCVTQYTIKSCKLNNDSIDTVFAILKKAGISLTPTDTKAPAKKK